MIIDILFLLLLIMSVLRGYKRGFVVAIFSFLAVIIGLAAAMKLSVAVAGWLERNMHINEKWLPFISFILVMIGVILLVKWLAGILHTAIEFVLLGWLDKLCGILLYAFLYITVYSIVLFYVVQMGWINAETRDSSRVYAFIEPLGPKAVNMVSYIIPFFKNMFQDLENFFASFAHTG